MVKTAALDETADVSITVRHHFSRTDSLDAGDIKVTVIKLHKVLLTLLGFGRTDANIVIGDKDMVGVDRKEFASLLQSFFDGLYGKHTSVLVPIHLAKPLHWLIRGLMVWDRGEELDKVVADAMEIIKGKQAL
jgi:hypothetical protein